MPVKNMIVLFDETGTPAISTNPRTDWFIGVAVAYQESDENGIFTNCEADFGLSNSTPLKNDRIGASRVIRMAKLLSGLPLSVYVSAVNTANPAFRSAIIEYELFGNKHRQAFRQIRKRPIPQIIHSHVLDHCLFNLVTGYLEKNGIEAAFAIFIDDWSFPKNDIDIALRHRAKSLYDKISPLCANLARSRLVSIAPLELLKEDSVRKRFVDGVTSTFNRLYLNPRSDKYSIEVVEVLKNCRSAQCGDATQHSIRIMKKVMEGAPGSG